MLIWSRFVKECQKTKNFSSVLSDNRSIQMINLWIRNLLQMIIIRNYNQKKNANSKTNNCLCIKIQWQMGHENTGKRKIVKKKKKNRNKFH